MKTIARTNSYNLVDEQGNIFYHAVAVNELRVMELAREKGIDISEFEITLEKRNVRDEMGRSIQESITDARVN